VVQTIYPKNITWSKIRAELPVYRLLIETGFLPLYTKLKKANLGVKITDRPVSKLVVNKVAEFWQSIKKRFI